MSLLKTEPAGVVESLEELFAIAYALEHESATRYAELGKRMRAAGDASLAETFERLASEEQGHLDSVVHWSKTEKGKAPDATRLRWALPETFNDEEAGTAAPQMQTPYGALSMAVRNEERAFAFWSYVAAHAATSEIKQAAESMAHEELEHVTTLRRARRSAYHAERSQRPSSGGDAAVDTAALEDRLADLLEALPSELAERDEVRQFAAESRQNAAQLANAAITLPSLEVPAPVLEDPVVLAELLVERYLEAADRLQEESALTLLHSLASKGIRRLAWLRAHLGASTPD